MTWGLILDSGCIIREKHGTRAAARRDLARRNAIARESKARGDFVTPRIAIGIATKTPKPIQSAGGRARAAKLSPRPSIRDRECGCTEALGAGDA